MNIINPNTPSHALTKLIELFFSILSQIKKIMSISEYTIPKLYLQWLIKWQAEISIIKSTTYRRVKPRRAFGESLQQPNIIHITRTYPEFIGYSPFKSQ